MGRKPANRPDARHIPGPGLAALLSLLALLAAPAAGAAGSERLAPSEIAEFVRDVAARHGLAPAGVERTLESARISQKIIDAMTRPAEAKPWYKYRPIFVTEERARAGADFWGRNAGDLAQAEARYGVPAEVICAIIGVETFYGRNTGSFRVVDALATLAFRYPPRAAFFRSELEHFLLLSNEQGFDPLALTGSYAGAMGLPQFISSSYRAYAVDFDGDGVVNIWDNPADAIGSVANYLGKHGWTRDAAIAIPAQVPEAAQALVDKELKVQRPVSEYVAAGIRPEVELPGDAAGNLMRLEQASGGEFWLGLANFYVITRYNRSILYAMAVHQLGALIRERHRQG